LAPDDARGVGPGLHKDTSTLWFPHYTDRTAAPVSSTRGWDRQFWSLPEESPHNLAENTEKKRGFGEATVLLYFSIMN